MKKLFLAIAILAILLLSGYFLVRKPLSIRKNTQGIELFTNGAFAEAATMFSKSVRWYSGNKEAHLNLIRSYIAVDSRDMAGKALERMKEIFPEDSEAMALEGQLLVIDEDFSSALVLLDNAVRKDTTLAFAYYYRGIARANLGDLAGAAEDYQKAQQLDISNLESLEQRAIVLGKLANYQEAISSYNQLLEQDPSNIRAFMQRGNFKLEIDDYNGAIADFTKALALDNSLGEAYFSRGGAYARNGQFEEAFQDFSQSANMNYKTNSSLFNSGKAALQLKQFKNAEEKLRPVTEDPELAADASQLMGVSSLQQSRNDRAIEWFNKTLSLNDKHRDAFYHRGVAYGLEKEYLKAIGDLEQSRKLGMNSPDLYYALGVNKIALNNFDGGCADLETAVNMGYTPAAQMRAQYCQRYMKE